MRNCAVNWCDKLCFLHLFMLTFTADKILSEFPPDSHSVIKPVKVPAVYDVCNFDYFCR